MLHNIYLVLGLWSINCWRLITIFINKKVPPKKSVSVGNPNEQENQSQFGKIDQSEENAT